MYRTKLNELINGLESHSDIELVDVAKAEEPFRDTIIKEIIQQLGEKLKTEITPEYFDFFKLGDGWKVYWTNEGEKVDFSGEFNLISMKKVLAKADKYPLWHSEMTEEEMDFYESLQIIDIHGSSGDGQYAAFKIVEGQFPFEIWFIDRADAYQMDLDYSGYLDALITTRGLHGWQYFFLTDYSKILSGDYYAVSVKKYMQHVLDGLAQLFPSVDITYYQNKFKEVFGGYIEGLK